ncbi:MAG: hypothetical protein R3B93_05295 [Bacteroidia bacterium]
MTPKRYVQTSYRIIVKDESGQIALGFEKINSGESQYPPYAGSALKPATKYTWELTVWDQDAQ